ncbi:hypothetical protein [Cupriavidus sp.]|uniref:hypothetical protein n=2 Tax=unclassified Cupriavidus TaxID=2640874 RepID=UPI0034239609
MPSTTVAEPSARKLPPGAILRMVPPSISTAMSRLLLPSRVSTTVTWSTMVPEPTGVASLSPLQAAASVTPAAINAAPHTR